MQKPSRFNIRVYGIWLHEGKMLLNEELIHHRHIVKFPGGGLDYGEGTIDCLKREWKEELDLEIEVLDHFYTTDFFQPSAFDNTQVISIYYWVHVTTFPVILKNNISTERTFWMPLAEICASVFHLPIDRQVGSMLQKLYAGGQL